MSTPENPIQNILRTAIQREIDAYNMYSSVLKMVQSTPAKDMLQELADQELGHRKRLEALLAGRAFRSLSRVQQRKVADLKITDYLIEEPLAADSDLQNVLIVAGKRERASYELYRSLARVADDAETVKLFDFLANEELQHKHRVESLYDQYVYTEN